MICGAVLLVITLMAVFAPLLAPHDPYVTDLSKRLISPFFLEGGDPLHPLGTDGFGRDYLSRLIYGARVSLMVGLFVTLISGVVGVTLGLVAGYFGGRTDQVVMFIVNTRLSMPVFLIALVVAVMFGASLKATILTLGFLLWERFAVVARSATQQIRSLDYITAARTIGASHADILLREVLPNVLPAIVVVATIEIAAAILLEAALSFLGFGVQEPTASWGLMLAQAREHLFFDPWLTYVPGLALFVVVMCINITGDGLDNWLSTGKDT